MIATTRHFPALRLDRRHAPPPAGRRRRRSSLGAHTPLELDPIEAVNFMAHGGLRRQLASMDGSWKRGVAGCPDLVTGPQQHNTGLDLTIPDAAHSIPDGLPCLLSGLAAQAHVGLVESV